MGGLPCDETRREPPEGDRVEVASIRRDPAAYKKFSRGCPDGAETDHAHRRVFALNRLSHMLQRSPPAFSRPLTGRRVDLSRSRLRACSELNTSRTRTSTGSGPFPGLIPLEGSPEESEEKLRCAGAVGRCGPWASPPRSRRRRPFAVPRRSARLPPPTRRRTGSPPGGGARAS